MTKPHKSEVISKITKGILPTTAIASGLLSQPSFGAPGDLDPTFGEMGRASFPFHGAAFRVQELTADASLIAGGELREHFFGCNYYYYFCGSVDGFFGQVSPTGSLDLQFATALLAGTEVLDFALQPDGKVVAVGQMISAKKSVFTVFRLMPGGLLDPKFADQGVMQYATDTVGQSVVLDPSGAIVVAGSNAGKLMVLRLLGNGALDKSFGNGGVYLGPSNDNTRMHIWRTGSGGYRVSATLSNLPQSGVSSCAVVALTAAGVVDTTFGAAGIAALPPHQSGTSTSCHAMTAQSDGSLLLGGQENGHGFVNRLLAGGALDPSFTAAAVPSNMSEATALAVDPAGSILVAGAPNPGVPGALILRLHATGLLDGLFGSGGLTWIDLPSSNATGPTLEDLSVLADGRVLAAGGEWSTTNGQQPLLVRLVGTSGTEGPGIIGATPSLLSVKEGDNAVVTVRRMGGATGDVSVAYRTADYQGGDAALATSGADYAPVTGRLTWADGDRTDRQITVPILTDSGKVEEAERFNVTLADAKGGAEIGTQDAVVEIAADGDPAGQFGFADSAITVSEADGNVQVVVNRNYYSKGAVSVTVTPTAGSATTAEFSAAPITLSWADGDSSQQTAMIPIVNEMVAKSPESFTVDLSNPTNGALIGPHSHLVVTINYDYQQQQQQQQPPPPPGGGGAFDWFALLCLGCVRWLRRRALPDPNADTLGNFAPRWHGFDHWRL
jgi:uncharacterized delta-60 repeat protein